MTLYRCEECGVRISAKAIMDNITKLEKREMISTDTWRKAKRRLDRKDENPFIACHNPDCDGLLMLYKL